MAEKPRWMQAAAKRMAQKGTKGSFTEQAHRAGYDDVQDYASKVLAPDSHTSAITKKRANFARNAAKARH